MQTMHRGRANALQRLERRARHAYHLLQENDMRFRNLLAAGAMLAAASAFAQQTEYVAPDAGFKPALTRAEVRQDLARAQSAGLTAQRQHDGQDILVAAGGRSREEVKAEAAAFADQTHSRQAVENIYFR
jgi:hypothetical protein